MSASRSLLSIYSRLVDRKRRRELRRLRSCRYLLIKELFCHLMRLAHRAFRRAALMKRLPRKLTPLRKILCWVGA